MVRAMAAWSARPCSRSRSSASNVRGFARRDGERADDLAARGAQRRGGHARASRAGRRDGVVVGLVRDARVGHVVEGPDRLPCSAARPLIPPPSGNRMPISHCARRVVGAAGRPRPGRGSRRRAPSGSGGRRRVASRRLASSTTRSRTSSGSVRAAIRAVMSRSDRSVSARRASAASGSLQLVDQARVGDGDGGLLGETAEDRGVEVVERVRLGGSSPRWRRAGRPRR